MGQLTERHMLDRIRKLEEICEGQNNLLMDYHVRIAVLEKKMDLTKKYLGDMAEIIKL
jgi:hypothetical protein